MNSPLKTIASPPNKIYWALLWLLAIVGVVYVSVAIFSSYKFAFHSDAAIKTVLARLSIYDGQLVPWNWVFANGDLFLISSFLFSVIIYPLLGMTYLSNATASWLGYLYLLPCVYGTCRSISPDKPMAAIAATAVAAGGISAANFEFTIAQGGYSMMAGLTLCLFAFVCAEFTASGWRRYLTLLLTFIAAIMACIGNSLRGDVTVITPILVGFSVSALVLRAPNLRARLGRLCNPFIYAIVLGAVTGTIIYKYWLLPSVFNYEAAARVGIAPISEIWNHLLRLPGAWFEYFQVDGPWHTLSAAYRLLQGLVWLIAVTLICAPIFVIFHRRHCQSPLLTLSWIVFVGYGVSFAAMVVSPSLFSSSLDLRYATFPIYGSVCIIAILVDYSTSRYKLASVAALVVIGVVGAWTGSLWHRAYGPNTPDAGGSSYAQRMALIRGLEKEGVGTALASYWNSHVLTVLSDGSIDAYPIGIGDLLRPFPHHMPRHLFYGSAGVKQAVVLSDKEASSQTWDTVEYQLGSPSTKRLIGPFAIWIYDHNIAQAVLETGEEIDFPIPKDQLSIQVSRSKFSPCKALTPCDVWVDVINTGKHALASVGSLPLRLGVHGLGLDGHIVVQDASRADFPSVVLPGKMVRVRLSLPSNAEDGVAEFQVCLLQEGVNWLCDRTVNP